MKFKDYYKILELENSKVTTEQIKNAYRKQAKKYHPDVNVGNKVAEERIKDINEAYRVLSNLASKRKYDRTWNYNIGYKQKKAKQKTSSDVAGEFFGMFFGNNEIKEELSQSKIPAVKGIQNGEKIRLIGQGKQGQNGGKNGDLYIKINIEDGKKYRLNGTDLHTIIPISPWEAALGTKAKVNSIDDTKTQIYIPNGIQSGEIIEIPQKGYKNSKGERGNLIAQIKIVVPDKLTKEETEMFKKLKEISKFNPRRV